MKTFLVKIILFAFVIMTILCVALFWVKYPFPYETCLGALPDKHALLKNAQSPKIVFVGGSSSSFGLDSRRIAEAFHMPVVNMGIHYNMGLRYMMQDILPYIGENDVIVLAPEYIHFHTEAYYGGDVLVWILFDIFPQGKKHVSCRQWQKIAFHVIKYATLKIANIPDTIKRKFRPKPKAAAINIYGRDSFNDYGDAYIHWDKPKEIVGCALKVSGKETVNEFVMLGIKEFQKQVQKKGAVLIMLPPPYQECSFNNEYFLINQIETKLKENNLGYLTPPSRYKFADDFIFNGAYHLNKQGVDLRTTRIIEDLRTQIRK